MLDAYPNHFLPIKDAPDEQEALVALLALGGYDPDSLGDGKPPNCRVRLNFCGATAVHWLVLMKPQY